MGNTCLDRIEGTKRAGPRVSGLGSRVSGLGFRVSGRNKTKIKIVSRKGANKQVNE